VFYERPFRLFTCVATIPSRTLLPAYRASSRERDGPRRIPDDEDPTHGPRSRALQDLASERKTSLAGSLEIGDDDVDQPLGWNPLFTPRALQIPARFPRRSDHAVVVVLAMETGSDFQPTTSE